MSDQDRYNQAQEAGQTEWESRCIRCGGCCGAMHDPCEHLTKDADGAFLCDVYANRFGQHRTLGGTLFHCIPVREIVHLSWPGDERCAYKKK